MSVPDKRFSSQSFIKKYFLIPLALFGSLCFFYPALLECIHKNQMEILLLIWIAGLSIVCCNLNQYSWFRKEDPRSVAAFFFGVGVFFASWLTWKGLEVASPQPATNGQGLFVGPYQINVFAVQMLGIVDTHAQRMGHLFIVGCLGLFILMRRPLLGLGNTKLQILTRNGFQVIPLLCFYWAFTKFYDLTFLFTVLFILFISHRRTIKPWVQGFFMVGCLLAIFRAIVPGFSMIPDLSHRSWDDFFCIQHHCFFLLTPGDLLAQGQIPYTDFVPSYGLMMPVLTALWQTIVGPLDWGGFVRFIQFLQGASLLSLFWLYYRYARGNWVYCSASLALILPYFFYDQAGIFCPNQSVYRFLGLPITLATIYTMGNTRPVVFALTSGMIGACCILINLETGVVMTAGLISFLVFRERILERWHPSWWARVAGGFLGGWVAFLVFFLFFYGCYWGNWLDWTTFSESLIYTRLLARSGLGDISLEIQLLPMVILFHSFFVVVQVSLQPGPGGFRRPFRATMGLMICLWFSYYFKRPHPWNLWSLYPCYGFLLIDLLRFLDLQLTVRKRLTGVTMVGAWALWVVIFPGIVYPVIIYSGTGYDRLDHIIFKDRPPPRGPVVSGIHIPDKETAEVFRKANYIKELAIRNPKLVYFTPHSFLIPKLVGTYGAAGGVDLGVQGLNKKSYQKTLDRLNKTVETVYLDARHHPGWGWGEFYEKFGKDLAQHFTLTEINEGWEVWRRKASLH